MHVPKTGGSALRALMGQIEGCYIGPLYFDEAHFGRPELAHVVPLPNQATIATPTGLSEVVNSHRLVMGHYAAGSLIRAGCSSIAMQVREPRARVLSLYRFWQAQSDSERESWGSWGRNLISKADLAFREFLACPEVWPAVDNALVRQAMGYRPRRPRLLGRRSVPSSLHQDFVRRLSIVEWSARSQEFVAKICEHLGLTSWPELGRDNATDVMGEDEVLDSKSLRLLTRLTSIDRAFLDRLCADRVLPHRSPGDLDLEFEDSAGRLGFRLG